MSAVPVNELETLRDWLRWTVSRFTETGLAFGHGSGDAYDEAAYLLLHALHLPLDRQRREFARQGAGFLRISVELGEVPPDIDECLLCGVLRPSGIAEDVVGGGIHRVTDPDGERGEG